MDFLVAILGVTVHSYHTPWFMYAIVAGALIGYGFLEARHTRRDHRVELSEAIRWSAFYIAASLLFAVLVFVFIGSQAGGEYLAAWAIEKALSLDNLFVIGLIFASLKVPVRLERRMLNYGIAGAIVFRLLFILAGFELLKRFEWTGIVFGLILLRAAWKALSEARHGQDSTSEQLDVAEGRVWKGLKKVLPLRPAFDGRKLTTRVDGKRVLTMMAAVIILIELTDIVFAVDSVPAVLAVSPDRFIAYSSNVFAILGLRALFFVYQAVADTFWAFNWALAIVLAWISFKLLAAPFGFDVPAAVSLGVLGGLFAGSIIVSLVWRKELSS